MIIIKTYWKIAVIALVIVFLLLGIIYVTPLDYSIKVGASSAIISAAVAILFSDLAGTFAARRFQEEDVKRTRVTRLQSLRNEIVRVRKVIEYYNSPDFYRRGGSPKMPMAAFETAFVSGAPSLAASEELVDAACEYLVVADAVNSYVDIYLSRGEDWCTIIQQTCVPLSEILNRLDDCLKRELEAQYRLA